MHACLKHILENQVVDELESDDKSILLCREFLTVNLNLNIRCVRKAGGCLNI